jgi:hypothetical protein
MLYYPECRNSPRKLKIKVLGNFGGFSSMHKHSRLVLATLALSAAAFAQIPTALNDGPFLIGYAANLTAGQPTTGTPINTSVLNVSNDGYLAGFYQLTGNGNPLGNAGNICVNVYAFNPDEEMLSCCSCLVTPNGIASLGIQTGVIANQLTPPIPALAGSAVIKLVSTVPGTSTGNPTVPTICNAATISTTPALGTAAGDLTLGMVAWGSTLEPVDGIGTYLPVEVRYKNGRFTTPATVGVNSELTGLASVCSFVQAIGSNFGICGTIGSDICGPTPPDALSGAKN